jgi:UDP-N-acetylmuramoyl-tripeptide--D-alanyl-D-alanine ligase
MQLNWSFVAEAMGGIVQGKFLDVCHGVSTDSRTIKQGELYFALSGDRFDGHQFAESAVQKGAAGIVVRRGQCSDVVPRIEVDEPLTALQMLGRTVRDTFDIPIIAITGSHGKTTTKDILASILSQSYKTASTFQNLNGLIGVPLTLLRLNTSDQMLVIEVGISQPGEMALLASIVKPSNAIFTCVAAAHSEFMPTLDIIAREKKLLMDHVQPGGHVILNADDSVIMRTCRYSNAVFYGLDKGNYRGSIIRTDASGTEFSVQEPNGDKHLFTIQFHGKHNVYNALAAISTARLYGISHENIQNGLDTTQLSPHRSQISKTNHLTIIDDAYNAAPESMRCALQILKTLSGKGRRIAVLGDMLELGERSVADHAALGRSLANYSIDLLVAFGKDAKTMHREAQKAGVNSIYFPDADRVAQAVSGLLKANDIVLVKASRSMRAEKILNALDDPSL